MTSHTYTYIAAILDAYLVCALWSSTEGDDGTPLDDTHGTDDIAPASVRAARRDVVSFLTQCRDAELCLTGMDAGQIGHDIWLTRNRHGAGFWDRGLGLLGDKLTDIAHHMGTCDAYTGDDGRVYFT